jgi:HTH-type transcriptional regulator/antitoxin HigA
MPMLTSPKAKATIKKISDDVKKEAKNTGVGRHYYRLCFAFPLQPIKSAEAHRVALSMIERLIGYLNAPGEVVKKTTHDVEAYLAVLSDIVERYERDSIKSSKPSARDLLEHLMQSNGLTQVDLAEDVGGQPVISAILNGKRELNLKQIKKLARRFKVSPDLFID